MPYGTNRRRPWLAAGVAAATVLAGTAVVTAAYAAAGCRVRYVVSNQWPGGFGASVAIDNLGDPINGWTLTWSFSAGQTISQMWGGRHTQAGGQVTVADAGWNGAIATNGSVSLGFNGTWNSSNPAPAAFTLNGTACTGAVGGTPGPSAVPTTGPPTGPPTSPPTTTAPPPPPPPPTGTPTVPPASYPNPTALSGDTGTHDPTVVRTPGGTYILAATGNNLSLKTSTDRRTWRNAGTVWPNGAPWTTAYTGGGASLWAPDISYRNGQYFMYYSASTFGSQRSAIFLATSATGAQGSWTNQGLIIESSTSVDYNAIDPNLIVDASGQWWLSFGSFWTGIKMIRLDPTTGRRSTTDTAVRALATRTANGRAIEAPFIFRHGGFYYLWVSFDLCCQGASSTYRIMVGRSTSVTGPYTDRNGTAMTAGGGTQVLAAHDSIRGPGHQAVIADTAGEVLIYHYYAANGASFLGINSIGYDSAGWPFVY
jgi:arabinan endo-1,5-alpha-L-arabinosidase